MQVAVAVEGDIGCGFGVVVGAFDFLMHGIECAHGVWVALHDIG